MTNHQTPAPLTDERLHQIATDAIVCVPDWVRSMAAELLAARARITELEAADRPAARCQETTVNPTNPEHPSCAWCVLPAGHQGMHRAELPQSHGGATLEWPNSAAPTGGAIMPDQTPAALADEQLEAHLAEMMARAWQSVSDRLGLASADQLIAERDAARARNAELEVDVANICAELVGARTRITDLTKRITELEAQQPYREVWSDETPPGGLVCSVCGQPVESEPCRDHAPAGYVVGWQEPGRVRIVQDSSLTPLNSEAAAYGRLADAQEFADELDEENPSTVYRVYELREAVGE